MIEYIKNKLFTKTIVTKQEKNYIVTRKENVMTQQSKWIYGAGAISLGVFWWGLS
jgi:thioredoxin reductase